MIFKYFLPFYGFSFHLFNSILWSSNVFKFINPIYAFFSFVVYSLGVFWKSIAYCKVMKIYPYNFSEFYSPNFYNQDLIHMKGPSGVQLHCMWLSSCPSNVTCIARQFFPHWTVLAPMWKINWLSIWGFISRFSILFCSSICPPLCQYHTTVLITVALQYVLKSEVCVL